MSAETTGYVYVANGEAYLHQARVSAASLRRVHPHAPITLISGQPVESELFDRVVVRPFDVDGWKTGLLYKVEHMYASSPYDRTFFVDTDTYFCAPCTELFDLLDYFDLCITDEPNDCSSIQAGNGKLSGYFPYCTGVMVFRRNAANDALFRRWYEIYRDKMHLYQHDQGPLAEALLEASSRVYVARSIYNVKLNFHVSLMASEVKIIHGRTDDYERVRALLNSTPVHRSWDPVSRACRPLPAIRYLMAYAKYLARQFSRPHN